MCIHGPYIFKDKWYCKRCGEEAEPQVKKTDWAKIAKDTKRRRPLTEWEAMKLEFYRDEKKWHDNITRRKIIKDASGNKKVMLTDHKGNIIREMPSQPKHLLPKAEVRQTGYQSYGERVDR